jgi:hypothetical protein
MSTRVQILPVLLAAAQQEFRWPCPQLSHVGRPRVDEQSHSYKQVRVAISTQPRVVIAVVVVCSSVVTRKLFEYLTSLSALPNGLMERIVTQGAKLLEFQKAHHALNDYRRL